MKLLLTASWAGITYQHFLFTQGPASEEQTKRIMDTARSVLAGRFAGVWAGEQDTVVLTTLVKPRLSTLKLNQLKTSIEALS